jgi:RHH-type proline utilization regulon transcriptional repressor/proline dehydrogenase/delta 1-pyrroline-5-carboxylate dehydrogenase
MSDDSLFLQDAREIIHSTKGKKNNRLYRENIATDLAFLLLSEAKQNETHLEKKEEEEFANIINDFRSRALIQSIADQCFRSKSQKRVADQLLYLLFQYGSAASFSIQYRLKMAILKNFSKHFYFFSVPMLKKILKESLHNVVILNENDSLQKHLEKRHEEKLELNIAHIGEITIGNEHIKNNLLRYLNALDNPKIKHISIKIPALIHQIDLSRWDNSLEMVATSLRQIYAKALHNKKNVSIDVDKYEHLAFTIELFKMMLNETAFHNFSAGIVLQSYFPDAYLFQQDLTSWAKKRKQPIKICISKGAYLNIEQVEASLKGHPLVCFQHKYETDANFKRMLEFGLDMENAPMVNIGVATHNLFDIAYAIILRAENNTENYCSFEMFEGRTSYIRRTLQKLLKEKILLFCPVAIEKEFIEAIAYIVRRFDENTGAENFLRYLPDLTPSSKYFEELKWLFKQSCREIDNLPLTSKKTQDRYMPAILKSSQEAFENDPNTDLSLKENRKWVKETITNCKKLNPSDIPVVIGKEEFIQQPLNDGYDPSYPSEPFYHYTCADNDMIEKALNIAKNTESSWQNKTIFERDAIIAHVAKKYREKRSNFISIMIKDGGKNFTEADKEMCQAIDCLEYYRTRLNKIAQIKDIEWTAKGTALVVASQGFPCFMPTDAITAALITGNCVIFKPSLEMVLTGWHLVNAMWEGGVPKETLIFLPCTNETVEERLIKDPRINFVILAGRARTAKKFISLNPSIQMAASCEGKNIMIISALSDKTLAIKDLVTSAFSYAGQKITSCSLAILEAEVYDDKEFMHNLLDAVSSLQIGPADDLSTEIGPLTHGLDDELKRALILEDGEEWLLEPKIDSVNPFLMSAGIKLGVKHYGYTHLNSFSGPILGLMRAKTFDHAIHLANSTPYGLAMGLHSLDPREHSKWLDKIEAGNCFINREMTTALIKRQPFGGCKESSFGRGYKAGGPNFLTECLHAKQKGIPKEKAPVNNFVNNLSTLLEKLDLSAEDLGIWYASISNYEFWWKKMKQQRDPSKIIGQDNFLRYVPKKNMTLRIDQNSNIFDSLRICAAALTCDCPLEISLEQDLAKLNWLNTIPKLLVIEETKNDFLKRIENGDKNQTPIKEVRLTHKPNEQLRKSAAISFCYLNDTPVLANGRYELLHYLREISISYDYHRYGNLGIREGELRAPCF